MVTVTMHSRRLVNLNRASDLFLHSFLSKSSQYAALSYVFIQMLGTEPKVDAAASRLFLHCEPAWPVGPFSLCLHHCPPLSTVNGLVLWPWPVNQYKREGTREGHVW